jgi:hypothetical protein
MSSQGHKTQPIDLSVYKQRLNFR